MSDTACRRARKNLHVGQPDLSHDILNSSVTPTLEQIMDEYRDLPVRLVYFRLVKRLNE